MATTFTTALHDEGAVTAQTKLGSQTLYDRHEIAAALIINDVIRSIHIPKGAVIIDGWITCDDLETSGSSLLFTLRINDGSTQKNFFASSTVGQAGGLQRADEDAAQAPGYEVTASGFYLELLTVAAPDTGATTGTIHLFVSYTMNRIHADL